MDLTADIVPGESMGGIKLKDDLVAIVSDMRQNNIEFVESVFSNFGTSYRKVKIGDGRLFFVADSTNKVVRLWCCPRYQGKYNKIFHPGMSVKQVRERSSKQLIIHGMLMINGEFGAGFSIPETFEGNQFDDVDFIADLPPAMVLEELHVMDREWWR